MDELDFVVKHFVACTRIEVTPTSDPPYTLHEVRYDFTVPADREWPARLEELWLFARFYNGTETRRFTATVFWIDTPDGEDREIAAFDIAIRFPQGQRVYNRGWNVSAVRFPGPGRYVFRLTDDQAGTLLVDEYISIWRDL